MKIGGQRSEVRKSDEIGDQRSNEIRNPKSEIGSQRSEVRDRIKLEIRNPKSEI